MLFKSVQTGFGPHTASYSIDTGALSLHVKAALKHTWPSLTSTTEMMKQCSHTSNSPMPSWNATIVFHNNAKRRTNINATCVIVYRYRLRCLDMISTMFRQFIRIITEHNNEILKIAFNVDTRHKNVVTNAVAVHLRRRCGFCFVQ